MSDAGWYPEPHSGRLRYFDGANWGPYAPDDLQPPTEPLTIIEPPSPKVVADSTHERADHTQAQRAEQIPLVEKTVRPTKPSRKKLAILGAATVAAALAIIAILLLVSSGNSKGLDAQRLQDAVKAQCSDGLQDFNAAAAPNGAALQNADEWSCDTPSGSIIVVAIGADDLSRARALAMAVLKNGDDDLIIGTANINGSTGYWAVVGPTVDVNAIQAKVGGTHCGELHFTDDSMSNISC
jgi:hypothetical protein